MSARAQLRTVAMTVVLAGGLTFLLAGRDWLTLRAGRPAPFSPIVRPVPGHQQFPAVNGLVVVALLAAALAMVTGRWVRRGLGVLVALTGVLLFGYAIRGLSGPSAARLTELLSSPATSDQAAISVRLHRVWPLLTGSVAVCFLAAGLVMVVRAASWSDGLTAKYAAPAERARSDDPWQALDRGADPTTTDG